MKGPRLVGDPADAAVLASVVRHLREGGLAAIPTETVYGFGCAIQEEALAKLQQLKGRGEDKPFLILVPGVEAVSRLDWTPLARELAGVFWPGALTLVLRDGAQSFPRGVRSPKGTVAVRQSPNPVARSVVDRLMEPIVSTSANPPGGPPALSAREALDVAGSLGAGDDFWVLDGGTLSPSKPSTVVDCSEEEPVVLRAGSIPLNRLRCVLPDLRGPA